MSAPVRAWKERAVTSLATFDIAYASSGTVGWSSSDGAAWALVDPTAILHGATIDRAYTANGSILLLGERHPAGGNEPVAWLLAP